LVGEKSNIVLASDFIDLDKSIMTALLSAERGPFSGPDPLITMCDVADDNDREEGCGEGNGDEDGDLDIKDDDEEDAVEACKNCC
jgi:hypothetical protein